jgi:hypothetical protein
MIVNVPQGERQMSIGWHFHQRCQDTPTKRHPMDYTIQWKDMDNISEKDHTSNNIS